jgi:transposase
MFRCLVVVQNQMPSSVKKRYFELVREGHMGAAAARRVGVSTSCGSLWFLDAGGVMISDPVPISPRFLDQDDRITIADGLHAGQDKKEIAVAIGKSFQTVYRGGGTQQQAGRDLPAMVGP